MKKKNLKNLHVNKSTVSNLNSLTGGALWITRFCPKPQQTETGCSQLAECDSIQICTANICKTNELDTQTRPIC